MKSGTNLALNCGRGGMADAAGLGPVVLKALAGSTPVARTITHIS
jgi:hypothetical protein